MKKVLFLLMGALIFLNHGCKSVLSPQEQNNRGVTFANNKNYPEALNCYRLSANLGNKFAQNNLGYLYYKGQGVKQDYTTAIKWFQLSAAQENAMAQANLGIAYAKGLGVTKNYNEAVKWFRLAAAQGDARAQFNLGVSYAKGQGVTLDQSVSDKWFQLASDNHYNSTQSSKK
jgi:TPR repeat protein